MNLTEMIGPERLAKGIFWTRALSLLSGCTPVSPGCAHCWLRGYPFNLNYPPGLLDAQGHWTGKVVTHPERLEIPLRTKKPQVFAIWSDLGYEAVPMEFRLKAFDRMEQAKQHIFLVVTKRPQTFLDFCIRYGIGDMNPWLPNIWLLTTAENQEQADKRLPLALQIPAAVRIALVEPCLGPVDLRKWLRCPGGAEYGHGFNRTVVHAGGCCEKYPHLDGVICGAEPGPYARPMHPDWPRQLRDDCLAAGVPFLLKSMGEWAHTTDYRKKVLCVYNDGRSIPFYRHHIMAEEEWNGFNHNDFINYNAMLMSRVGKKAAGRLLDGRTWEELPG